MFKDDGTVLHFTNPKGRIIFFVVSLLNDWIFCFKTVQAAFQSRTCVVVGQPETKCECWVFFDPPIQISYILLTALQELLPEIIHQIGPDAIPNLKKIAENVQNASRAAASAASAADNDDDIPPLVDAEEAKSN